MDIESRIMRVLQWLTIGQKIVSFFKQVETKPQNGLASIIESGSGCCATLAYSDKLSIAGNYLYPTVNRKENPLSFQQEAPHARGESSHYRTAGARKSALQQNHKMSFDVCCVSLVADDHIICPARHENLPRSLEELEKLLNSMFFKRF